jgi:hypothetical protein
MNHRGLVFALLRAIPTTVVAQTASPPVKTRQGIVEGKEDAAVHAFAPAIPTVPACRNGPCTLPPTAGR